MARPFPFQLVRIGRTKTQRTTKVPRPLMAGGERSRERKKIKCAKKKLKGGLSSHRATVVTFSEKSEVWIAGNGDIGLHKRLQQ